jgi:hypothetical protein
MVCSVGLTVLQMEPFEVLSTDGKENTDEHEMHKRFLEHQCDESILISDNKVADFIRGGFLPIPVNPARPLHFHSPLGGTSIFSSLALHSVLTLTRLYLVPPIFLPIQEVIPIINNVVSGDRTTNCPVWRFKPTCSRCRKL